MSNQKQYDPELAYFLREHEPPQIKAIKEAALYLAETILQQTPPSAEQTLALREIESAVLRARDSIEKDDAREALARQRKKGEAGSKAA